MLPTTAIEGPQGHASTHLLLRWRNVLHTPKKFYGRGEGPEAGEFSEIVALGGVIFHADRTIFPVTCHLFLIVIILSCVVKNAFIEIMIVTSAPYDCSGDDSFVLSCVEGGPEWWQIGRQIGWSLFVWGVVLVTSPMAKWVWFAFCYPRPGVPPRWALDYIGTEFRHAKNLNLENMLCLIQFFASSALVWIWVQQSYAQKTIGTSEYQLQFLCVFLCFLHALFDRFRFGFSVRHACSLSIFLDCLTLPPIITQGNGAWAGGSWLTLAYLRTYHCWKPMKRLLETDFFDHVISDFVQQCVLSILECILVVFSIAGTLWLFEGMGDIEGFSDQFTDSGMGGISFFQMVYFSFVTISTVGFGDYSPTTVLSRAFSVFAIFGGVTFFSYLSVRVFMIYEMESSGKGKFVPKITKSNGRGHLLIMGGGVTCGSVNILETFLKALCRSDSQTETPEIVLLGQSKCSEEFRQMLNSEWAQDFDIHYFVGSPLNPKDLIRVRAKEASMTFVIANFHATETRLEDQGNALFASAVERSVPNAQLRLMLIAMPSLSLCSSIGIPEYNFFSIEVLKASMMATSIRCPGFSTLILNLGLPDLPPFDAAIPGEPVSPWLKEYVHGCRLEPYGFLPGEYLIGLTFTEAAVVASDIAGVLLLGAQIEGGIRINPKEHVITDTTVVFAMAENFTYCDVISCDSDARVETWITQFQRNRKMGSFWKHQHEKSVRKCQPEELEKLYLFEEQYEANQDEATMSEPHLSRDDPLPGPKKKPESKTNNDKTAFMSSFETGILPINKLAALSKKKILVGSNLTGGNGHIGARQKVETSRFGTLSRIAHSFTTRTSLRQLARQGGHTVLVLQEDFDELDQQTLWQQIEVISNILRHAGDTRPIIVVHSLVALPSRKRYMATKGGFGKMKVAFCVGDPLNPLVLQAAGVDTCARLLTIAPSAPPTEISPDGATLLVRSDEKKDESNLMLVMLLEEHLSAWGSSNVKTIYDWYAPASLNLLPYPKLPPPLPVVTKVKCSLSFNSLRKKASFVSPLKDPFSRKVSIESPETEMTPEGPTINRTHRLIQVSKSDLSYAQRDPRGHYRFAAGQVVPKPFIAALYSMAYYTPGVLEIMESLINPHQYDQDSMPWIFKVPSPMIGVPYNVVANELLKNGTLPLGLLRDGGEEAGTPLPYVVALTPSSGLLLRASDCIYVLAEHDWAVKHGLDGNEEVHAATGRENDLREGISSESPKHLSSAQNSIKEEESEKVN